MGIKILPCVIGGRRVEDLNEEKQISSLDGSVTVSLGETSLSQLRAALRYADESQRVLNRTPLEERIRVAKLVMKEYAKRREEVSQSLALFRGLVVKDSLWMCDVLEQWAEEVEDLVRVAMGNADGILNVESKFGQFGKMLWKSKGKAALFSSSTMDGPAGIAAICHGILSGSHVILRPSWKDAVTHIAYEILVDHGLGHYGQLVRWQSDTPQSKLLNKQILSNVSQSLIFSSNETYHQLMASIADPGTSEWESLVSRSRRYGTGLPLAIVTGEADLEQAATDLIEGARLGSGKFCLSVSPVLVCQSVYEKLKSRLIEKAKKLSSESPNHLESDLGFADPAEKPAMLRTLENFGGQIEYENRFIILGDVPQNSACLYQEFPSTLLSLIPVPSLETAVQIGQENLKENGRTAWTAAVVFGTSQEMEYVTQNLDSYRYCQGGVVSQVKLLLPHQGTFFLLDLMRRVTFEPKIERK